MLRRSMLTVLCVLVLWPTGSASGDLVGNWPFNGNLNDVVGTAHGTFNGGQATYQKGKIGQAIWFDGVDDYVNIPSPTNPSIYTIAAWVKPARTSAAAVITRTDNSGPTTSWSHQLRINPAGQFHHYLWVGAERNVPGTTLIVPDTWYHVAIMAQNNGPMRLYVNGKEDGTSISTAGTLWATGNRIYVGSNSGHSMGWFQGLVDDLQIYDEALPDVQIKEIMKGLSRFMAQDPAPEDAMADVPRDVVARWTPGEYAGTHDVYFGTNFTDVNEAGRANPMGVLASRGQTATEFDPDGLLEFGRTYYWRVDEVNATPDNTIFKGETWSFTAEPFAYPITAAIAATASSAQPGMAPENTVNGAGLDALDQHSTEPTQMWMTNGSKPAWIQFELDKAYKLDSMLVWNSNQLIEGFLGFGAKDVTIEYSADGATWTTLEGVPGFAKATGMPTYTANTMVDFGGAVAKLVKLTINANHGGVAPQTGLAEVRFFYVPVQAFEPSPAVAATGVSVDDGLSWRPGREAQSHEVYVGVEESALALADTLTEHNYTPVSLDFGTTYYWKVDELGGDGPYEGDIWNFTTQEYAAIDDFEAYTDDIDAEATVWHAWIDGLTTGASGSQVGYDVSPFAEKAIVHGGGQSMPLQYDNAASPFVSEAERTFASARNWTANGADSLIVYFRGEAPGFAQLANGNIAMNAIGTDIWNTSDEFRFAYKTLNGDGTMVARVESIANSNTWAKGGVMIRQSVEPGSVHAYMSITPGGGNGASFQRRPTANAASANNDNTGAVVAAPYWVKIERKGNAFSGYISPDGVAWTQLGTAQTVTMTGPVLIGLALCSHDAAIVTGAEFSAISSTGNVTGAWQVAEIGATQPVGNSLEGLYVSVKDTSGKSKVVQHSDTAATAYVSWQEWKIPLSEFTSAGVKMNAVRSMVIGVGNKAAPKAGGAGIVYVDDIGYGHAKQ